MLSIVASFIQLTGYGTGFLRAWWKRCVLKKDEFAAFEKNFCHQWREMAINPVVYEEDRRVEKWHHEEQHFRNAGY